jgi:hypothetical protein
MVAREMGEGWGHISMVGGQRIRSAGRVTTMVTVPPFPEEGTMESKRGTSRVDGRRRMPRADVSEFLKVASLRRELGSTRDGSSRKTATKPAENSRSNIA